MWHHITFDDHSDNAKMGFALLTANILMDFWPMEDFNVLLQIIVKLMQLTLLGFSIALARRAYKK
jgi:hypothetical protein